MKIILLGSGITGKYVTSELELSGYEVFPTSRNSGFIHKNQILFDLENSDTWKNLPLFSEIVWIFPPTPVSKVQAFIDQLPNEISIRIVLGTTSVYVQKNGRISELSEVDQTNERVKSEKILLDVGAIVLRCAGLYSLERHPYHWLKAGRITNGNKSVNLIHQKDLATIIVHLLDTNIKGDVFNISDGKSYVWKNIAEAGKVKNQLPNDFMIPEKENDHRTISNHKILNILQHDFKFHDEGWIS